MKHINELSAKAKLTGLTEAEKDEHLKLRTELLAKLRANFTGILDNTIIVHKNESGERPKIANKTDKQAEDLFHLRPV